MQGQKMREEMKRELSKTRNLYGRLITDRLADRIKDNKYFSKMERLLNSKSAKLKKYLGIGCNSMGGANCEECKKFFNIKNPATQSILSCSQHQGLEPTEIS